MTVRIIRPEDRRLERIGTQQSSDANRPDAWIEHWVIEEGSPYLHMTRVSPGFVIEPHSHSQSEVTIILSGSVHVGDEICGPGSVLVIDADEKYGLVAGEDEPLTFAVMRPRKASYQPAS